MAPPRKYANLTEQRRAGMRAFKARRIPELRELADLFKNTPCTDCGNRFPLVCMDFDHRNPDTKVKAVADMVGQGYNVTKVLEEIMKCDVVCANCHRIRHHGAES